jgi:hypothetical protein
MLISHGGKNWADLWSWVMATGLAEGRCPMLVSHGRQESRRRAPILTKNSYGGGAEGGSSSLAGWRGANIHGTTRLLEKLQHQNNRLL